MEVYEELFRWAGERGIELNGVEPRSIPGRGMGIVATRPLKANERILHVPASTIRTLDTVRPKLKKALPKGTTAHALLAADLALDKPTSKHAPWNAIVPSREDITSFLPLAWSDPALHTYLPPAALTLLHKQRAKFTRDWTALHPTLTPHGITLPDYLYTWLLVNTRTFYRSSGPASLPRENRIALQPVADLFNHTSSPTTDGAVATASSTPTSFTITTAREYEQGEEVYICYGQHSNDVLMVEYGFVPATNQWDEVCLDEVIIPEFSEQQLEVLEECGFLGRYVLDAGTVCYRTQVTLRLLCVSEGMWRGFVEEGEDGGEVVQKEVDGLLVRVLKGYRGTVERMVGEIGALEIGEACQREMLVLRWRQIGALIDQTIERLES